MNVHLAIAMLEAAEGRREESREAARTAVRIFDGTAEKAIETRLALRFDDLPRVRRWMDEYVALVGDRPSFSHGEAEQLMLARAYLATGQVQRARLFLLELQQEANGCDRAGTTLIIRSILALVEDSDGHPEQAEEHVRAALDIAMREGFVRSLLDEGPAFLDILRRTIRRDPSAERRDYARSILSSNDHVEGGWVRMAHDGSIDPLTPRQQEVLRLVADGRSNREIADQLYLAEGTVKAHMHQIFNKLMVRNRAEAIRAAQRLGLAS
jgi:LuxR family transcriptional regulator, maltose regulon positive regulatory protein